MIKKAIFALIIFLLANTANAIITASWNANDPTEGVTKYTLYYKIANGTKYYQKKKSSFLLFCGQVVAGCFFGAKVNMGFSCVFVRRGESR